MKLQFDADLDFQHQAVDAVCDLFRGQQICQNEFTVVMQTESPGKAQDVAATPQRPLPTTQSALGVGNLLTLTNEAVLKNLVDIQLRNGIAPATVLGSFDFTVEMETGTGKTYVYLRTIYELNRRYGFTKFVIVVPSVAIKEGTYKTLNVTREHFKALYGGVVPEHFLYDSGSHGDVLKFATGSGIQIMVMTIGAINKKDVNTFYKETEKTGGEKPIDLINATHPVVIVDEPQSVDGGVDGAGKVALKAMNPLCTLRYSATHVHKHHMVFRLDALDAYERKLVKQIEVASASVENAHNKPFVRLVSLDIKKGLVGATIEVDVRTTDGVKRKTVKVTDGDDLEDITKRELYRYHRIGEINAAKGYRYLTLAFPGGEAYLEEGQAYSDVDALALQRQMMKRTIREHLDKEKMLRPMGIKVLSLFFIDAVERYRRYDEDGNAEKGDYARMFEEEYLNAARSPAYRDLFTGVNLEQAAAEAHDGYFSIDKKGGWSNTAENNATSRNNAERAYNLIMKDKEKLLALSTPLKFIFSHSALREGWDNPNVFQICSLREMGSERERRQTIGRGLRLCVRAEGNEYVRVQGFDVNRLTVIATESYKQFAENLQKEIEAETGIRFNIVQPDQFAGIGRRDEDGKLVPIGAESSHRVWEHLKAAGYLDAAGKVQDSLRQALADDTVSLPDEFTEHAGQIIQVLWRASGRVPIKNADERRVVELREGAEGKAVYLSNDFRALWDRIKHHTTYRVNFDNEKLLLECTEALANSPAVPKTVVQWRKADLTIGQGGVEAKEQDVALAPVVLHEADILLPDFLTELQDRTQLTRKSLVTVLTQSGRLDDVRRNPQRFIDQAADIINRCKRLALVDGIQYRRIGDSAFYRQELFANEELTGYLRNMLLNTKRSIHEHVIYDSMTEKRFAEQLEKTEGVVLYTKLPGWFKVPTPLGAYNPDWAVLFDHDGEQRLYFVVETKSTLMNDELRKTEEGKIRCGAAHFRALAAVTDNPARFVVATSFTDVLTSVS